MRKVLVEFESLVSGPVITNITESGNEFAFDYKPPSEQYNKIRKTIHIMLENYMIQAVRIIDNIEFQIYLKKVKQ